MTYLVGQQLGRYLVQEEIGRGGMARVYRALDTQLKRTVALKVLAPQLAVDPEFAQRFEREAVTAANLRHPNIVTIFDVGEHNGLRYIAMEYVRGRTLHAIIEERGALGLGYAIAIIGPIAAALDYAHTQGAVHRDVKPQNVIIDAEGRVLLTDFGIAQAPEGSGDSKRLTRTGIFMGTPEYISPEQASAQRVDGRSDLYSLGIATYEVITGAVPFSGATPQLIVAHAQTTPPPPSSIDPRQPPELDLVIGRILAKRPDQRFASGAAFVESLRVVARKYATPIAGTAEVASLVAPPSSSAGQSTVSLGRGQTPVSLPPPQPAPLIDPADPTQIGVLPARASAGPAQAPVLPPARRAATPLDNPEPIYAARPSAVRAAPVYGGRAGTPTISWIVAGVLGGLFLVLLFVLWRTLNAEPALPIRPTGAPLATFQATIAPSATPTTTPTPTPTLAPSAEPTNPPAEPTSPPAEPTRLPPRPTLKPPVTVVPSDTPVLPTDTPVLPSDTPVLPTATATLSPTLAPPTATATSPPATSPTLTATTAPSATVVGSPSPPASATATLSPTPTSTPSSTPTATNTPTPTITFVAGAPDPPTDTPTPTATDTPTP